MKFHDGLMHYARLHNMDLNTADPYGRKRDRGADNQWEILVNGRETWYSPISQDEATRQSLSERFAMAWARGNKKATNQIKQAMHDCNAYRRNDEEITRELARMIAQSIKDFWDDYESKRTCESCKTHLFDDKRTICHNCGQGFHDTTFSFESEGYESPNIGYASNGYANDYRFNKEDLDGHTEYDEWGNPLLVDEDTYINQLRKQEEREQEKREQVKS